MQRKFVAWLFLLSILAVLTGGTAMAFEIKSSAFVNEGQIPAKYTCQGSNASPPLSWKDAPAGTKCFALIADDPDAPMGTWVHWVAWNIPATSTSLKEGVEKNAKLSDGTRQGINNSNEVGYDGPCPPSGTHRYYFKLYALDSLLELPAETTKARLEPTMKGRILAQATVMGTYSKGH